jgi:hypothetical protein
MLVIKIEMWPGGDQSRAYPHGEIRITNISEGAQRSAASLVGDYLVELFKSPKLAKAPGVWKRATVRGFPRRRLGTYDLLLRGLAAAIPLARNPEAAATARYHELGQEAVTEAEGAVVADLEGGAP